MTDTGIPIPTNPNGYLCAECGETGRHAANCPRLRASATPSYHVSEADRALFSATAAEVAALRERVGTLEDQIAVLFRTIERHLVGHIVPRQPKGPGIGPHTPIRNQPAKRTPQEKEP